MSKSAHKTDAAGRPISGRPRVISFLSGKGGVGKSVLSFNAATILAAAGDRKVLLVDADFTAGNLHILANRAPEHGIGHFMGGCMSLGEAVTKADDNLDFLASTWNGPAVDQADVTGSATTMNRLREQGAKYDFILVDHGSGISSAAIVMAHGSDINVLVLVPELTSISNCYGLFKTLVETNSNIDCRLLLNRAMMVEEAEYIHNKFLALTEKFLGQAPPFIGYLFDDDIYRRSIASQRPVLEIDPNSQAVQGLRDLCAKLTGDQNGPAGRIDITTQREINNHKAMADIRE
ncbi:MAG: AAA family ATPase [candidate division Zixibacteria bacterium]|nr:AAA family ATPase [candidate division Zixibacteria bacterium]